MRILILSILLTIPALVKAQHSHFIYLQGENQQLFYVKKSGDMQSSSTTGFLILPKLQPGTHKFTVGFPKDQFPEYEFKVEISGKDRGFTLKNFPERGWGLVDLQNQDVIMGKRIDGKKEAARGYGALSDDPFSVILASAVNDPGIRETSLVQSAVWVSSTGGKPEKGAQAKGGNKPSSGSKSGTKPAAAEPVKEKDPIPAAELAASQKPDNPVSVKQEAQETAKKTEPKDKPAEPVVKAQEPEKKPEGKYIAQKVVKVSELKTWSGYHLTFVDQSTSRPDTIEVIIDDGSTAATETKAEPSAVNTARLPRTDCKTMAREKDVLNLRKKMLTVANENEMVEVAMKDIRSKCYTVDQLQNLSYVFVTDPGRLSLFEQAYPYIFDPANFGRLERLLNTEEYLNKFKLIK